MSRKSEVSFIGLLDIWKEFFFRYMYIIFMTYGGLFGVFVDVLGLSITLD